MRAIFVLLLSCAACGAEQPTPKATAPEPAPASSSAPAPAPAASEDPAPSAGPQCPPDAKPCPKGCEVVDGRCTKKKGIIAPQ